MERYSFNTAIARLIELNNELVSMPTVPRAVAEPFVLMLAPVAPHIAEELWQRMGHGESLAYSAWPTADPKYLQQDTVEVAVQVNGKVRGAVAVAPDADKDAVFAAARAVPNVARFIDGKTMRREIYVPGKIVNFVTG
jgi:leucyl-tRNA synthetase